MRRTFMIWLALALPGDFALFALPLPLWLRFVLAWVWAFGIGLFLSWRAEKARRKELEKNFIIALALIAAPKEEPRIMEVEPLEFAHKSAMHMSKN